MMIPFRINDDRMSRRGIQDFPGIFPDKLQRSFFNHETSAFSFGRHVLMQDWLKNRLIGHHRCGGGENRPFRQDSILVIHDIPPLFCFPRRTDPSSRCFLNALRHIPSVIEHEKCGLSTRKRVFFRKTTLSLLFSYLMEVQKKSDFF